ncbi:MAG: hypothetical protein Q9159_000345 [Coniocarpon cinnabarinum]
MAEPAISLDQNAGSAFLSLLGPASKDSCNGSVKDWCAISKLLPGRSNKDCRKRFSKVVKSVNKGTWSPEEDRKLIEAIETCGPRLVMPTLAMVFHSTKDDVLAGN